MFHSYMDVARKGRAEHENLSETQTQLPGRAYDHCAEHHRHRPPRPVDDEGRAATYRGRATARGGAGAGPLGHCYLPGVQGAG